VLHGATGWGGGGGGCRGLFPSELCGARDGEPKSVNATRRDGNDMLLVRYDH